MIAEKKKMYHHLEAETHNLSTEKIANSSQVYGVYVTSVADRTKVV